MAGSSGGAVEVSCARTAGEPGTPVSAALDNGNHQAVLRLRCPKGTMWMGTAVLPQATLTVDRVELRKLSAG
jgi:hypothetical protein